MTILVDASLKCNLKCIYCYNHTLRAVGYDEQTPDLEKIKTAIKIAYERGLSRDIVLHGGEPLAWGKDVVEELLRFIYQLTGKSGVQTNGTLIDDDYIDMFKKYKTHVGISIDGFGELNKFRYDEKTASKVIENLVRLVNEGIPVGVIVVLSKANTHPKAIEKMKQFLLFLNSYGVTGRLNPCMHPSPHIEPNEEELKKFYLEIADFMEKHEILGWSPYIDIVYRLTGRDGAMCRFKPCDPYATLGAVTITHDGKITTCHKFSTYMLEFTEFDVYTRLYILKNTDCKGCRYFGNCVGGCPAEAYGWDWRNKTRWCKVWYALFSYFEKKLKFAGIEPCVKKEEETDIERLIQEEFYRPCKYAHTI